MIVISIMGIVVGVASTTWMRQREIARSRACQENLAKIEWAKEQYAINGAVPHSATPVWSDLIGSTLYIKAPPHCPGDGVYTLHELNASPTCDYVLPAYVDADKFTHQAP
jgi:type II secretory pathway pseudopilin PulG